MWDPIARAGALGRELKRRRVYRTASVYLAVAFVALQVADILFPAMGVPTWLLPLMVVAAVAGFPVMLVLTWVFDVTAHGVRRSEAAPELSGLHWAFVGVVFVLSAGLGWGGWALWVAPSVLEAGDHAETVALDPARIAVLYFDDHSPGQDLGYLANGLTEGLIHELAQVEGLEVLSRHAVKPFRDGDARLDSVVRALGAGSVVEGSLTRSGGRLRLTVQLIDGATGTHLESRIVDRDVGELLALQDALTDEVSRGLRRRLGMEVRRREVRSRASSDEAWALVQRALEAAEDADAFRRGEGEAARRALERADSLLTEAEDRDPDWIDPTVERAALARTFAIVESTVPGRLDDAWSAVALDHLERALDEHPGAARALELRGRIRAERAVGEDPAVAARLRRESEADLRAALRADPGLARAWWTLSRMYVNEGRFPEARRAAEEALRADAFLEEAPQVVHELYFSAMNERELGEATRWCDEGRRRFPDESNFVLCQLFVLASVPSVDPDVGRAWRLVDSLEATVAAASRDQFRAYGTMQAAKVLARAGMSDSARAVIRLARGDATPDWLAYDEAHARLLLGERERALELLRGYLRFKPSAGGLLAEDWWFEALRDDHRFRAMTAEGDG